MAETRTTIDSLIELLKSKGKMELGAISMNLGVDPKIVEGWAKVLEKGSLVKISYEVGKMYVAPATLTPEQETQVKSKLEAKTVSVGADISAQLMNVAKLSEMIENIKASTVNAEKVYAEQMPALHKTVSEINRMYDTIEERDKSIKQISKKAEELYDSINKRITELNSRIDYVDTAMADKGFDDVKAMVSQVTKDASSVEGELTTMRKTTNDSIDQIEKNLDAQVRALHSNIEKSRRELEVKLTDYTKQMDGLDRQLRERTSGIKGSLEQASGFSKEKERLKRQLNEAKVEFNNSYVKASEGMKKNMMAVEGMSKDLRAKLDSLKQGFGEASVVYDSINSIRKQMEDVQREVAQTKDELTKMDEQLRALKAMTNISLEQKTQVISEMETKTTARSSRLFNLRKKVDKAAKEAEDIAHQSPPPPEDQA